MIRRGDLSSRDRIATFALAVACVILGTFGLAVSVLHQMWSAAVAAVFVLVLGIIYARAASLGRSLDWPRNRKTRVNRERSGREAR